ncbi:MAG: HDOD domain-containing protein [Propionivibrio sp.]
MSQTVHEAAAEFRAAVWTATVEELSFPTSLDASRRVLKAVENPDLGMASLAKIVVAEPLLSAKVIRLANSVALNPANQTIRDVRQAVLRVGMDPIKSLAMVLIMDQLRQIQRHSACRDLANRLWERNVHVAALSYVLARKLTKLNADEVMFAGIVHDLGRFYLLSRAAEFPVLLEDTAVLAETINDLAERATGMVLDKLKLPASVIDTVLASRSFSGNLPPATMGDLLFIAAAVSPRRDPFDELDTRVTPRADSAASLGLDQSVIAEVIAESGDEIYSIVVALES